MSGGVRKVFGTVTSNQTEVKIVSTTAEGGKGKGKLVDDDGSVQLQIEKLVNQEVLRQLAAGREEQAQRDRQLQMLLDQEEQRNARLTAVERDA